jgi:hypothetical protein
MQSLATRDYHDQSWWIKRLSLLYPDNTFAALSKNVAVDQPDPSLSTFIPATPYSIVQQDQASTITNRHSLVAQEDTLAGTDSRQHLLLPVDLTFLDLPVASFD